MAELNLGDLFFNVRLVTADVEASAQRVRTVLQSVANTNGEQAQGYASNARKIVTSTNRVIGINDRLIAAGLKESAVFENLNRTLGEHTSELTKAKPLLESTVKAELDLGIAVAEANRALKQTNSSTKGASNTVKQYVVDLNKLSQAKIKVASLSQGIALGVDTGKGSDGAAIIRRLDQALKSYNATLNRKNVTEAQARAAQITFNESTAEASRQFRQLRVDARKAGETVKTYSADLNRISNAGTKVASLRQRIRLNPATARGTTDGDALVRGLTRANKAYSAELRKVGQTAEGAARAHRIFNKVIARTNRRFTNIKAGGTSASEGVSQFTIRMRNLTSAATLAVGPLSGIGARVTSFAAIAQRSSLSLAALIAGVTGAGFAFFKLIQLAVRVGKILEDVRIRLKALAEHTYLNVIQFTKLQVLAYRTGQQFEALAKSYSLLTAASKGTNLEGHATFKVLEDLSFAAGKFKLSNDQVNGVLLAFTQILSKGRVQAEEITGQLSERLPGAFNIAARAMGVTTAKFAEMLRKGEIVSDVFLPKFAAELRKTYGATSRAPIESLTASQNRLANSYTILGDNLGKQLRILETWKALLDGTNAVVSAFADNLEGIVKVSFAVSGALVGLAGPAIFKGIFKLTAITKRFGLALKALALLGVARNVAKVTTAFKALNITMLANPAFLTAKAFQVLAVAAVGIVGGLALADQAIASTTERQMELNAAIAEFLNKDLAPSQSNIDASRTFIAELGDQLEKDTARIETLNKRALIASAGPQQGSGNLDVGISLRNQQIIKENEEYDALAQKIFRTTQRIARLQALIGRLDIGISDEVSAKGVIALDRVAARVEVLRDKIRRLGMEQTALKLGGTDEDVRRLQIQEKGVNQFNKTVRELSKVLGDQDKQIIQAAARRESEAVEELERKKDSLKATQKAVGGVNNIISAQEKEIRQLRQLAKFNDPNLTKAQNAALADAATQINKNGFHLDTYIQKQRQIIENEKILAQLRVDTSGGPNNAIRNAQLAITKLNRELENSKAIQGRLQQLRPFQDLEDDLRIADEVASFVAKLEKAKVGQGIIDDLTGQFEGLLVAITSSNIETAKLVKNMDNMQSIADDINETRDTLSFFNAADVRYGEQTARTLADVAYNYSQLTEKQKASTVSLQEYRQAIINADIENKRVANIGAAYTATFGAIRGGIDDATKQFSMAVAQWDKELLKFKDISQVIVAEIVNAFLQLAVIGPLIDNIFAGNGNGYLNNIADSFKSIFTNQGLGNRVASAGSFAISPVSTAGAPSAPLAFARGGVINSPTTFGTSAGPAIAGERGAEAILPLMRDSSGNLGVASSGGNQRPINVIFNFAPGTDESGFRRSQSQIEAGVRQAVERGARNG